MFKSICVCFRKYHFYSDVLGTKIFNALHDYCTQIQHRVPQDQWNPLLSDNIKWFIIDKVFKVVKRNKIRVFHISDNQSDFIAYQIAFYVFRKMMHDDDEDRNSDNDDELSFSIHSVPTNDTFVEYHIPTIDPYALAQYKFVFGDITGRHIDLSTTQVVDKFLLNIKLINCVRRTLSTIDFNSCFMTSYRAYCTNENDLDNFV
jgi:hypothetical protein